MHFCHYTQSQRPPGRVAIIHIDNSSNGLPAQHRAQYITNTHHEGNFGELDNRNSDYQEKSLRFAYYFGYPFFYSALRRPR